MQATEMLTAILIPLGICAMIFGIIYLNKRENLAMIEKGMNPKAYSPAPFKNLKWGLLLVGAGFGLFLAYLLSEYVLHVRHGNPVMYFSLIAIGGGVGLISSYKIEKKEVYDKRDSQ